MKDTIHNRTTTVYGFWDRIKILFGRPAITDLTIYTDNEVVHITKTEAKAYVAPLIKRKPKGGLEISVTRNA